MAALMGATAAFAADSPTAGRVLGYQDTETGTFHALAAVVPDAASPTTGTLHVTFNIKLVTAFPKGTLVNCSASLIGSSFSLTAGTGNSYQESGADSVAISGTTATCTVVIPYSWLVTPPGTGVTDSFSGSYGVSAAAGNASTGGMSRSTGSTLFTSTKIPANGTTSVYTVNVTL